MTGIILSEFFPQMKPLLIFITNWRPQSQYGSQLGKSSQFSSGFDDVHECGIGSHESFFSMITKCAPWGVHPI